MRYDEQYMLTAFSGLLESGETSLCPVYCTFKPTGFLASAQYVQTGFATLTDKGRLLTVRCTLTGNLSGSYSLDDADSISAKKTAVFKQHLADLIFTSRGTEKQTHLRLQIAPKAGSGFPNQGDNAQRFADMIAERAGKWVSAESRE